MRTKVAVILCALLSACAVPPTRPYHPPAEPLRNFQQVETATYVLVPGWLYERGGDTGADLHELRAGLDSRHIPYVFAYVKSSNSQNDNAHIIANLIHRTAGALILVTASRGTGEAAEALTLIDKDDSARIKLWI